MNMNVGTIFGILAVAIIGYLFYQLKQKKKTFEDLIQDDARGFFNTMASVSTAGEVLGLAILGVVNRGMPLFSALMRYGGLGLLEMVTSYYFITTYSKQLKEKAATDNKVTFWEGLVILSKSAPWFIGCWYITSLIWLLYLESIYRVEFVIEKDALASIWKLPFFWTYLHVEAIYYGLNEDGTAMAYDHNNEPIISRPIDGGAWIMIYMTQFLQLFLCRIEYLNVMRMIREGEFQAMIDDKKKKAAAAAAAAAAQKPAGGAPAGAGGASGGGASQGGGQGSSQTPPSGQGTPPQNPPNQQPQQPQAPPSGTPQNGNGNPPGAAGGPKLDTIKGAADYLENFLKNPEHLAKIPKNGSFTKFDFKAQPFMEQVKDVLASDMQAKPSTDSDIRKALEQYKTGTIALDNVTKLQEQKLQNLQSKFCGSDGANNTASSGISGIAAEEKKLQAEKAKLPALEANKKQIETNLASAKTDLAGLPDTASDTQKMAIESKIKGLEEDLRKVVKEQTDIQTAIDRSYGMIDSFLAIIEVSVLMNMETSKATP